MQVKYIGNHVKKDSIPGVGLVWEPGQQREVTSTVASHLLAYTDTWIKGDQEDDKQVDPQWLQKTEAGVKEEPIDFMEKDKHPEEPIAVVDFHSMNVAALKKYAKDQWNENFDGRLSESTIRERVIKRHTSEQMDEKEGK